jgi:hypothetical protein
MLCCLQSNAASYLLLGYACCTNVHPGRRKSKYSAVHSVSSKGTVVHNLNAVFSTLDVCCCKYSSPLLFSVFQTPEEEEEENPEKGLKKKLVDCRQSISASGE